jgi:putative ABC transport system permease protein
MIAHLLRLVWNRKKTNLLLVAEIFCAFLVVFALAATALNVYDLYRDPLGYDYRDAWSIAVARNTSDAYGELSAEDAETYRRLLQALEGMDEVIAAAAGTTAPYGGSVHISGWEYDNRDLKTELMHVTPEFLQVMQLDLVAGRWFTDEDDALDWKPIVIDRDMARTLVGTGDAVGERIGDKPENQMRVIGVVSEFRRGGEFNKNGPFTFGAARLGTDDPRPLNSILIRVAPGTQADFEEPMLQTLQSIARGWTFSVSQLEVAREWNLRTTLLPIASLGLVAGFLLVMVVLGLTGIMWQNVTRRTREIGLRRAAGAHRGRIHRQIVGEVMLTASLGLIAGALLAIQVPILGPFTFVPYRVVIPALAISAALILLLAGACGLYPGWSATRIQPAEALHYE